MKWLFVCMAVFFMVAPAMAGEDPYVAIVGNDCSVGFVNPFFGGTCPDGTVFGTKGEALPFYFSPKHLQFMLDQTLIGVPVCASGLDPKNTIPEWSFLRYGGGAGCESFLAQGALNQAEVCDITGTGTVPPFTTRGTSTVVARAGNSGFFEWWIRLPKKPSGEINLVFECGVLKPNSFAFNNFDSIELCAAETGERVGPNCTRVEVDPGVSPVQQGSLPKLTAIAYPGPFNSFTPFHLTAFKNPGSYTISFDAVTGAMSNNAASQTLDGSTSARILLKACMDKSVVAKLPVTGQLNACANANIPTVTPALPTCFGGGAESETDLEMGDIIQVRLDIPRANSVDIYCGPQSARLAGVGEAPF